MRGPRKRKAQAAKILKGLRELYPDAHCELDYANPLELAVATILSAQCTDKRVNAITPPLFEKYRTARDYAQADLRDLESLIHSAGFFRSKALSIKEMAKTLVRDFNGVMPRTMDELLRLRGVARKTANVILGNAYGQAEGVVVDTHMKRLAFRMGLTNEESPEKVEKDLISLLPRKEWIYFSHAMIWHGRRVCKAIAPNCPACALNKICPRRGV